MVWTKLVETTDAVAPRGSLRHKAVGTAPLRASRPHPREAGLYVPGPPQAGRVGKT